jgi:multiple sugar transport system substrate-binding protein
MKAKKRACINKAKLALATGLVACSQLLMTASAEDITLNWAMWNYSSGPYYKAIIDAYEAKHPGVNIEYVDLGSTDYNTMLLTQLTADADFDVFSVKSVPQYSALMNKGNMLKLNDRVAKSDIDTSAYSGLVEEITVNGDLYALPYRSDFWMVYYNKDLFDKAGVDYPTNDMTFEQYDELAAKLSSGFGANKVYGSFYHTWRSTVELAGIMDGKHTLADGNYDFLIPSYKRALKQQKQKIVPSYGFLKTTKTHYSGPFFNGQLAMLPMGSWFIASQIAKVKSGESKAVNWGLVKYPHLKGMEPGTTASTITSMAINSKIDKSKQDAAFEFIKFIAGPEGAAIFAKNGTIPALRTDAVINSITAKEGFPSDPASKEAMVTYKTYLEMPVNPKVGEIELVLNRAHDAIMTENVSIEEGIKEMNEGVSEVLKR